jgi:hypothetical protein
MPWFTLYAFAISFAYNSCPKENSIDPFPIFSRLPPEEVAITIVVSWATAAIAGETKNRNITKTILKNIALIVMQNILKMKI